MMNDRKECPHGRSYYEEEEPWEICGECRKVYDQEFNTSNISNNNVIPLHLENFATGVESFLKDWYGQYSGPLENTSGDFDFDIDINVIPESGLLSDLEYSPVK